jgi:two-component system, cell cycle sensor histidine kinase and response regulator CckA
MPAGSSDRFFELTRDLLVVYATDGTIRRVNAAMAALLGQRPEELRGQPLLDFIEAEDLSTAAEILHPRHVNARREPLEVRVRAAGGAIRTLEWRAVFDGAEEAFYGAARDVTDEAAADAALRHSEERYRALFESHPVPMAVWDPATGTILAANDAALRQYGYAAEEIVGMGVDRLVHPDDLDRLREAVPEFSSGVDGAAPFRHLRRDGSVIEVEVSGHDLDYGGRPARVVMALDITERRQLEEQLRQAQKMEAIGRLAGGIAHDFNNMLTAITGYSQLLLDSFENEDPRRDDVEQVHAAAMRASALTGQLLGFSRRAMIAPTTLDLNEVIRETQPMLERLIGEHIAMTVDLRAKVAWIRGDRSQVEQVVVNLALNARDAMPTGGMLRIETEDLDAAAAWAQGLASEASVILTVADDGVGIADEDRERVFEPFFTTKEPGQGTGLGLSTVYSTVRAAGGRIRLLSEPGHGTTFRILLPLALPPGQPERRAVARRRAVADRGRILLVEDEPAVRDLVARVLRRAGFDVIAAPDGRSALTLADADPEVIDLLLTDVVMPVMSGVELSRELRARRPEIRILLMSGYTEESLVGPDGALDLLPKPFTDSVLLTAVRSSLAQPGGMTAEA